jgi:hypothetical protein
MRGSTERLFQAFKANYNLYQEKQLTDSFFQQFSQEISTHKINEEEAFHYLMLSESNELIFLFLDVLYDFENNLLSLAQEILLQEKMSLDNDRLCWFFNKILKAELHIQKSIFEMCIVQEDCFLPKNYTGEKGCLSIVSTYREKDTFPQNYCNNIFTYLVHCLNKSFNNQDIIPITKKLVKNYQTIYQMSESDMQQSILPTLLAFSSSIYISSIILTIFNSNLKDKSYHPYLVLPFRHTSNLGLSQCQKIIQFYADKNISSNNISLNGENLLHGIFSHLISIHYLNNTINLLEQHLELFSSLGYDYRQMCQNSKLEERVNFILLKIFEQKKEKSANFVEVEKSYLSFKSFLIHFHNTEKEGKKIKI